MRRLFSSVGHSLCLATLCLTILSSCQSGWPEKGIDRLEEAGIGDAQAVHALVDGWHQAATEVDAETYLGSLTEDAVFLGTDPGERWDKAGFTTYVDHYFRVEKRGWEYVPSQRHVKFSESGRVAWFDEHLESPKYGALRGTGVARYEQGVWRIAHFSMTFAILNDRAKEVVELLRQEKSGS